MSGNPSLSTEGRGGSGRMTIGLASGMTGNHNNSNATAGGSGGGAVKKDAIQLLDEELANNGLLRYRLEPPSWRLPWITPTSSNSSYSTNSYASQTLNTTDGGGESRKQTGGGGSGGVGATTALRSRANTTTLPRTTSSSASIPTTTSTSTSAITAAASNSTVTVPPKYPYPQFYPTETDQVEFLLSEQAVKSGYIGKTIVQTETFSAHQLIYEKLKNQYEPTSLGLDLDGDDVDATLTGDGLNDKKGNETGIPSVLSNLTKLCQDVWEESGRRLPGFGAPTFRLPSRVTLNEARKESWISDLANPSIPLSKLSKTVPHGYRGEKLLEMLEQKRVKMERAVWYIRAIGAIEINARTNSRPGYTAFQYTQEWTTIVMDYVHKQLSEIRIPLEPNSQSSLTKQATAYANPKQRQTQPQQQQERKTSSSFSSTGTRGNVSATSPPSAITPSGSGNIMATHHNLPASVKFSATNKELTWFTESELRKAWTERFSYVLNLLEALYEEQLLDRITFFRSLIDLLQQAATPASSNNISKFATGQPTHHANLDWSQLPFILLLIEQYIGHILDCSESICARLAFACLECRREVEFRLSNLAMSNSSLFSSSTPGAAAGAYSPRESLSSRPSMPATTTAEGAQKQNLGVSATTLPTTAGAPTATAAASDEEMESILSNRLREILHGLDSILRTLFISLPDAFLPLYPPAHNEYPVLDVLESIVLNTSTTTATTTTTTTTRTTSDLNATMVGLGLGLGLEPALVATVKADLKDLRTRRGRPSLGGNGNDDDDDDDDDDDVDGDNDGENGLRTGLVDSRRTSLADSILNGSSALRRHSAIGTDAGSNCELELTSVEENGMNEELELLERKEMEDLELIEFLDSIHYPQSVTLVWEIHMKRRRKRRKIQRGRESGSRATRSLKEDLSIYFTWATCEERYGQWRIYLIANLIRIELDRLEGDTLSINGETSRMDSRRKVDVEASFISWLDSRHKNLQLPNLKIPDNTSHSTYAAIRDLLAELIRLKVINYSLYMQSLIARGETERVADEESSVHLQLLRTVPLPEDMIGRGCRFRSPRKTKAASLSNGYDTFLPESALLQETVLALVTLVPALLGGDFRTSAPSASSPDTSTESNCSNLTKLLTELAKEGTHTILTQRIIPEALLDLIRDGNHLWSGEDHAIIVHSYLVSGDYFGLLQYLLVVLTSPTTRDILAYYLDTVERYLNIWAAMGQLPSLAMSLQTAHKGLKARAIHDRRLLVLLKNLGQAGHLVATTVAEVEVEIETSVLSLSTSRSHPGNLPAVLPELQSLLSDTSPQAIAQVATTLRYRYHAYENWGAVVFDNSLSLIAQIPLPILTIFLREIHDRLPLGLDVQIAKWVAELQPASMARVFSGSNASKIIKLFMALVIENTLSVVGLLSAVVLPIWRSLLVDGTESPIHRATSTQSNKASGAVIDLALQNVCSLFSRLLGINEPERCSSEGEAESPAELLRKQRIECRRASLYIDSNLSNLGRCIAMLVIQQELFISRDNLEGIHETRLVLAHLSTSRKFLMAATRSPQTFASAILDGPFIEAIPAAPSNRPKLLAVLLLMLKDSSTDTPVSLVSTEDLDLFLSGLTMWRLEVSKVEVQACLERLDLDMSLSEEEKSEALYTLAQHFVDRVCSGAGHTYLGEQIVKCYHGKASDELVSVAFSRLSEAVDGLSNDASFELKAASLTAVRCTNRVLRKLLQGEGTPASRAEPFKQLLVAIRCCLLGILTGEDSIPHDVVLHLTHLLRIALSCKPIPGDPYMWDLVNVCLIPLVKLIISLSQDRSDEDGLLVFLLDSCAVILYSLASSPTHNRIPTLSGLVRAGVEVERASDPILSRLSRLFENYIPPKALASPWDLVDHASDQHTVPDSKSNTGPIDLAYFNAKIIDVVPTLTAYDAPSPAVSNGQSEKGQRTKFDFETPCTGLSLAARDHRRTLTGPQAIASKYDPKKSQPDPVASFVTVSAQTRPSPPDAVPNPTVPVVTNISEATPSSTAGNVARGTKRKEVSEVLIIDSDDDEPVTQRAPPSKRGRGSVGGKSTTGRGAARKKPKS